MRNRHGKKEPALQVQTARRKNAPARLPGMQAHQDAGMRRVFRNGSKIKGRN
jgi:hypothetical protein